MERGRGMEPQNRMGERKGWRKRKRLRVRGREREEGVEGREGGVERTRTRKLYFPRIAV